MLRAHEKVAIVYDWMISAGIPTDKAGLEFAVKVYDRADGREDNFRALLMPVLVRSTRSV